MSRLLLDTNAHLFWHREPHRLTGRAAAAMRASVGTWVVSAITFVEIKYLIERGRIEAGIWADAVLATDPSVGELEVLPVTVEIAAAMDHVPRRLVADMPDRIIAATAIAHGLPLVTADRRIQAVPGLAVVW